MAIRKPKTRHIVRRVNDSSPVKSRMENVRDIFAICQSAATILAILIGGIWTYYSFVYKRERFPKLDIATKMHTIGTDMGKCLVSAEINIKNTGYTLVQIDYSEIRLQKILPFDNQILNKIASNALLPGTNKSGVKDQGDKNIEWPLLAQKTGPLVILEPDEEYTMPVDFEIDTPIELVRLYAFFPNAQQRTSPSGIFGWLYAPFYQKENGPNKEDKDFGWSVASLHELKEGVRTCV